MLSRRAAAWPICHCPQIPWPGRRERYCVHGHGLTLGAIRAPAAEPLERFAYHFGIDLSKLGRVA